MKPARLGGLGRLTASSPLCPWPLLLGVPQPPVSHTLLGFFLPFTFFFLVLFLTEVAEITEVMYLQSKYKS